MKQTKVIGKRIENHNWFFIVILLFIGSTIMRGILSDFCYNMHVYCSMFSFYLGLLNYELPPNIVYSMLHIGTFVISFRHLFYQLHSDTNPHNIFVASLQYFQYINAHKLLILDSPANNILYAQLY